MARPPEPTWRVYILQLAREILEAVSVITVCIAVFMVWTLVTRRLGLPDQSSWILLGCLVMLALTTVLRYRFWSKVRQGEVAAYDNCMEFARRNDNYGIELARCHRWHDDVCAEARKHDADKIAMCLLGKP